MAQAFKVVVNSPATAINNAKTWTFTQSDGHIVSIETSLKREKHRISTMTIIMADPKFQIFSQLPDPAFSIIPVQFYMAPPESPNSPAILIFDGKITSLQVGYPAYDKLTIVAHDYSIDMRRQKKYRTLKNKTSVQIAQTIAADYAMNVSVDSSVPSLVGRLIEFQGELSDWDCLARALSYDGLELYVKGKTITVRLAANTPFQPTFYRDSSPVVSLSAEINHIGLQYDKQGAIALENSGTYQAASGARATEAGKETAAKVRTHRHPVGSPPVNSSGSHAELPADIAWTNQLSLIRRRKDSAKLTCSAVPGIGLQHLANLSGWGAKIDGAWFIEAIHQSIVPESGYARTDLDLIRGPSPGASASAGIPFAR